MSGMRSEVIQDFATLEQLSSDWDRLWREDPHSTIFGSFAWAKASWKVFGADWSLCTTAVFQNEELVCILPMAVFGDTLTFIGTPRADYNHVVHNTTAQFDVLESAFRALLATPIKWKRCVFAKIPEESWLATQFDCLEKIRDLHIYLESTSVASYLDLHGNASEIVAPLLRKKTFRSYENKLRRQGELHFRHIEQSSEILAHLPGLFQQHMGRWTVAGGGSIFTDERNRHFYEELAKRLDPSQYLRFSVLELDGRPIAQHFGFESHGRFIYYKPTFDIDFWNFSPGQVLLRKLLEYSAARKLLEFDFTTGDESYKRRFTNRTRQLYTISVFRSGLSSCPLRMRFHTKRRLKKHYFAIHLIKKAKSTLNEVSDRFVNVFKRRGILGFVKFFFTRSWQVLFFSRNEMHVFKSMGSGQAGALEELELLKSKLSDLVSLAAQFGEYLTPTKLAKARERLRQGDTLYTFWIRGECAHIAWVSTRSELMAIPKVDGQCRINVAQPAALIYDCWTPPAMRGKGIYPSALLSILRDNADKQLWIHCQHGNIASVRGIDKAGFKLCYRMLRTRLLGCIKLSRVDQL